MVSLMPMSLSCETSTCTRAAMSVYADGKLTENSTRLPPFW